MNLDSTQLIIDLDAIRHNIRAVHERAGVPVMAIIKADAYGHGAVEIARHINGDCAFFGVSSILEALLRLGSKRQQDLVEDDNLPLQQ